MTEALESILVRNDLSRSAMTLTAELINTQPGSSASISCSYPSVSGEEGTTFFFPIAIPNKGSSDAILSLDSIAPGRWAVNYSAQDMSGVALNNIFLAAGS